MKVALIQLDVDLDRAPAETIERAAGATPGPDIVATVTLRAGLRGASSRTTIPGWTVVSAKRGMSATPTPAATRP